MANSKTVYLIRHAESLENHRIGCVKQAFTSLGRFKLPDANHVKTGAELLNVSAQVDSDVSEKGRKQIDSMGTKLKEDNFVVEHDVQLAVHSPLLRARQTCDGMIGCCDKGDGEDQTKTGATEEDQTKTGATEEEQPKAAGKTPAAIQLACLAEKTPSEWLPGNLGPLLSRIDEFETFLSSREERVVAVVGHSQYFKEMLGLPFKFGNCEVWRVEFDPENKEGFGRGESTASTSTSTSAEEKKEGESGISSTNAEEEKEENNASATTISNQGVDEDPLIKELPRGWSNLKNVYRCSI